MTNTTGQIEIELSKKKLILMLVGAIAFVIIGLWFVIAPPTIDNPFFGNPTRLLIIGIVAIVFFGLCSIVIAHKILDNKAGIIIDNVGIIDNSSGVAAGQIIWSDIENISTIEIHRQKIIMLEVKNPQDYIDKQTSGFKRRMMQLNFNMYGTPLSITSNSLKIDFDDLFKILNDQLNESRQC